MKTYISLLLFGFTILQASIITLTFDDVVSTSYTSYTSQGVTLTGTSPIYYGPDELPPCIMAPLNYPGTEGCQEFYNRGMVSDPSGQNPTPFMVNPGDIAYTHITMGETFFSILSMDVFEFTGGISGGPDSHGTWRTLDFTQGQVYNLSFEPIGINFSNVQYASFIGGHAAPVYFDNIVIKTEAVPEPASLFLFATGLCSFGFFNRKKWNLAKNA